MTSETTAPDSMPSSTTVESLGWINRLVEIDSTSRLSNHPVLDVLAEEFSRFDIEPVWQASPESKNDADAVRKSNLVATIAAADGTRTGGVVISGHTDVVPVDGQAWSSDAFVPEIRDEKLYGRGTADMKAFIAIAMHKLPRFVAANLNRPIHFAFTYDEEVGCLGGAEIVKLIADLGLEPDVCFVGEPSSMRVVRAHKGINVVEVTFEGVAAHSSLTPQGVNSIEYAGEFVSFVRQLADTWRADGPFDEAYVVPFTTTSVNKIGGGTAQNIVPERCEVLLEFRNTADVKADDVLAQLEAKVNELAQRMSAEHPSATVHLRVLAKVPGLETGEDSAAQKLAVASGGLATEDKVTYGTEAGQFSAIGIDTVVVGPGDIAQAHAADEFVSLDQIRACEDFFDALLDHLTS